jgi:hypothetical protein
MAPEDGMGRDLPWQFDGGFPGSSRSIPKEHIHSPSKDGVLGF